MDEVPPMPMKPRRLSRLAMVSIWFGVSLIAVAFFQWKLEEYLTPFLLNPLFLCLLAALGLLVVASIIYLLLNLKNPKQAVQPLLINVATGLVFFFVPFTDIWLALEFRSNLKDYNEVVDLVEEGHLQPNDIGLARLPQKYHGLSQGDDIIIDTSDGTLSVFFFTFRGILDNYSGFMYRSDDTPPGNGIAWGDWFQVERKRAQWYFCASR
jgi:hypothetical protein